MDKFRQNWGNGGGTQMATFAADLLLGYVREIEQSDADISELQNRKAETYARARSEGFDVKALKTIIKLRKKDKAELEEQQAIIDTYLNAIEQAETRNELPKAA